MTSVHQEQRPYVSCIPHEIFAEILHYLGPSPEYHKAVGDLIPDTNTLTNRTIKNMSLVCRHFYFHLFPFRLETMLFVNDDPNQLKYKLSHCRRFCQAIVNGNVRARTLAQHVKRCAIGCFDLHKGEPTAEKQFLACTQALSFMTNLHELHIFRTSITNELLDSMLSLPPLEALRLDDCNVPAVLDQRLLRQFSTLHATHLSVRGIFFDGKQPATDLFLNSLCISHTKSLTCNGSTCFHFLRALVALGPLMHLSHLHIAVLYLAEYKELISDALFCMPALEHLHLGKILHWQSSNIIPFDPFVYTDFPKLPRLEYIHAPVPVLQALIPGSRVSTIGIATEMLAFDPVDYTTDTDTVPGQALVSTFQKSRGRICELDVPMNFYLDVDFQSTFPHLRRLKIRLHHILHALWLDEPFVKAFFTVQICDFLVKNFTDAWAVHPELLYLEFVVDPLLLGGWELSDDSLALLASNIPSLQTLVFSCQKGHCDGRESERREYLLSELELDP